MDLKNLSWAIAIVTKTDTLTMAQTLKEGVNLHHKNAQDPEGTLSIELLIGRLLSFKKNRKQVIIVTIIFTSLSYSS